MATPRESPTAPAIVVRPNRDARTLVLVLTGRVGRDDVPGLCLRARDLLAASDADRILCDVGALSEPDAVTVETLARLQLAARRRGRKVLLHDASERLLELLDVVGLSDVLPPCAGSGVEPQRQIEQRKEPRGVEEEADPRDLPL